MKFIDILKEEEINAEVSVKMEKDRNRAEKIYKLYKKGYYEYRPNAGDNKYVNNDDTKVYKIKYELYNGLIDFSKKIHVKMDPVEIAHHYKPTIKSSYKLTLADTGEDINEADLPEYYNIDIVNRFFPKIFSIFKNMGITYEPNTQYTATKHATPIED